MKIGKGKDGRNIIETIQPKTIAFFTTANVFASFNEEEITISQKEGGTIKITTTDFRKLCKWYLNRIR